VDNMDAAADTAAQLAASATTSQGA
jgi:hypothetical protein